MWELREFLANKGKLVKRRHVLPINLKKKNPFSKTFRLEISFNLQELWLSPSWLVAVGDAGLTVFDVAPESPTLPWDQLS